MLQNGDQVPAIILQPVQADEVPVRFQTSVAIGPIKIGRPWGNFKGALGGTFATPFQTLLTMHGVGTHRGLVFFKSIP